MFIKEKWSGPCPALNTDRISLFPFNFLYFKNLSVPSVAVDYRFNY